jgi:hypothetical protein
MKIANILLLDYNLYRAVKLWIMITRRMDERTRRTIADENVVYLSRYIGDYHLEDDNGMAEEVDRKSRSG